jgi:calcineurin-like phosphoesterase family protein
MIYLTGCTHFGHHNIIRLANRPFGSVEEMDEILIENWNKTVKPEDTVVHHGDFSYKGGKRPEDYLSKLNGTIIRIRGNHDQKNWGYSDYEFVYKNVKVVCYHYPIEEWNGYFRGAIHTHCHTHKPVLKSAERRFNVTVEACEYKPISIDELMGIK